MQWLKHPILILAVTLSFACKDERARKPELALDAKPALTLDTKANAKQNSLRDPWEDVLLHHEDEVPPRQTGRDQWVIRAPGEGSELTYDHYNIALLRLILDKTVAKYGPYQLKLGEQMNRLRAFVEVRTHLLDVAWSVSTTRREEFLRPVRREIIGGMNGYRVLMIRQGEQNRYDKIAQLTDLKALVAGGGYVSHPAEIWRANDLPMVTSDDYRPLFSMLSMFRFDYFPRAIFEASMELEQHRDLALTLEKNLLLHFEAPAYFFVSPERRDLQDRLTEGMDMAQADGSLLQLFTKIPNFRQLQQLICTSPRRTIEMANGLLPPVGSATERSFFRSPQQLAQCAAMTKAP